MSWIDFVHPSWRTVFSRHEELLHRIQHEIVGQIYCPASADVLRAFSFPLEKVKIAIFGQDPYPNPEHASGLAFSVPPGVERLPKSLANIFRELNADMGGELRMNGDLSDWSQQGVALINRVLTTPAFNARGHHDVGWQRLTDDVARELSGRGVIAILWGKDARELEKFFLEENRISSVHPSPLSAYRGFFGSRPFSKANQLLLSRGEKAIDWLSTN